MNKCLNCDKGLSGRQRKFCSDYCKNSYNNNKYQKYEVQRKRGFENKLRIFLERGGKCEICGYNKNLSAIDFHHLDPSKKEFKVDIRSFSNNSKSKISIELEKCTMICANCHREQHNPTLNLS